MELYILLTVVGVGIISAVGVFLWWLRKNDDYWKKRGVPYAPRASLIKIIKMLLTKPIHEVFLENYKKFGRVHGEFELRKPSLIVSEPDLLRDILVKDFYAFNYRRNISTGDPIIDKMVSILKGEDWKRVRTIMTPAFTSKRMRKMTHIINECSQTVLETFGKHFERGELVDVKSIFGAFTMDVIASAAFATKIDSFNDPENIFVKNVKKSFIEFSFWRIITSLIIPTWFVRRYRLGALDSMDFFKDVITQVIRDRREKNKKYDDILQMLLDAQEEIQAEKSKIETKNETQQDEPDQFGSIISSEMSTQKRYKTYYLDYKKYSFIIELSEDELVAQSVLFFIVGYETTASTLTFLAYSLALNPECQEKLIKEVDEAYKKHEKFDYDALREMMYLDCVVSETLRIYPFLTRSERTACEDYKLGNTGIVIEKGTTVGFNIHALHFDPEFFPNPEKFDPERFMPENSSHPQYAYLPFGAGPRNCLGMRFALLEIKLCICNILRHFRFKKGDTTPVHLKYKRGGGILSVANLPLITEKRKV